MPLQEQVPNDRGEGQEEEAMKKAAPKDGLFRSNFVPNGPLGISGVKGPRKTVESGQLNT